MADEIRPADFDWVSERHKCSAITVFELLYMEARKNMDAMNALAQERGIRGSFEFTHSSGFFTVVRKTFGGPVGVRFLLYDEEITIETQGGSWGFTATLTLNDDGECRLLVDGKELDRWQVLRRALEPLFFGTTSRAN